MSQTRQISQPSQMGHVSFETKWDSLTNTTDITGVTCITHMTYMTSKTANLV